MKIEHLSGSIRADFVGTVSLRCPSCRQNGTFDLAQPEVKDLVDVEKGRAYLQRRCPNPKCRAHVFVVLGENRTVLSVYPPEMVEVGSAAIPDQIVATFEQALRCRSIGAQTGAAVMIRRTLEALCAERQATGNTLIERIGSLAPMVALPQSLLDGAKALQLLADDAALVEAAAFDRISAEELDVAILFTKELLRSAYQYADLVGKLEGLRPDRT